MGGEKGTLDRVLWRIEAGALIDECKKRAKGVSDIATSRPERLAVLSGFWAGTFPEKKYPNVSELTDARCPVHRSCGREAGLGIECAAYGPMHERSHPGPLVSYCMQAWLQYGMNTRFQRLISGLASPSWVGQRAGGGQRRELRQHAGWGVER